MKLSLKHGLHVRQKALAMLAAFVAIGCGSSTKPITVVPDPSLPTGLPTPSAPGQVNTYSSAQSPGAWTVTLNSTNNTFSYRAITYPNSLNQPATGAIQPGGGFSI